MFVFASSKSDWSAFVLTVADISVAVCCRVDIFVFALSSADWSAFVATVADISVAVCFRVDILVFASSMTTFISSSLISVIELAVFSASSTLARIASTDVPSKSILCTFVKWLPWVIALTASCAASIPPFSAACSAAFITPSRILLWSVVPPVLLGLFVTFDV
ncbi:hypothetical protein TRPE111910_11665 [Treponema peruense]